MPGYDPSAPRHTYRGEDAWFELLEDRDVGPFRLRRALIASGLSPQVASGIVFFLDDQRRLERYQDEGTRTRYRAALRELDPKKVRARAIGGQFNSRRGRQLVAA